MPPAEHAEHDQQPSADEADDGRDAGDGADGGERVAVEQQATQGVAVQERAAQVHPGGRLVDLVLDPGQSQLAAYLHHAQRAAETAGVDIRTGTEATVETVLALPAEFTPSYKGCVEAALGAARAASVTELGSLLLAPFLFAGLLRWVGSAARSTPLVGFGVAAVLAGLVVTLGGRATRATLSELRRRLRGSDASLVPRAAAEAESFGELVGVTAASSVEALAFVLALTVLCLAPLLS